MLRLTATVRTWVAIWVASFGFPVAVAALWMANWPGSDVVTRLVLCFAAVVVVAGGAALLTAPVTMTVDVRDQSVAWRGVLGRGKHSTLDRVIAIRKKEDFAWVRFEGCPLALFHFGVRSSVSLDSFLRAMAAASRLAASIDAHTSRSRRWTGPDAWRLETDTGHPGRDEPDVPSGA